MAYQFGQEPGGFSGWQGNWQGGQTPVGSTGQGLGFGNEQGGPMGQQFWQQGQMPWTGTGMGMGHTGGGQFGGPGFAPWHFFWQMENILRQHPNLHFGLHQMLGNMLLSAPMHHFFPGAMQWQFPGQQWTGGMGFGYMPWMDTGTFGMGHMPWMTGMGGFGSLPFPGQQSGFGGTGGMHQPFGSFGTFGMTPGMGSFGAKMTDEQIVNVVYDCMESDPFIPADLDVTVECRDGMVTINGTCPNKRIKHHIGEYCWWLPGVVDVTNQMRVTTRRQATEHQGGRGGQSRAGQTGSVPAGSGTRG